MKIKIGQALGAKQVLSKFLDSDKLGIQASYKIMKALGAIENEESFYYDSLSKIVDKFGKRNENGEVVQENGTFLINPELKDECAYELSELEGVLIDLPDNYFTLDELAACGLTPRELNKIEFLLKI